MIVGLGNPGPRYAATRHNIGFMVVDELARKHGLRFSSKQGNAEIARGDIAGEKVILAKPQTFMNNSGTSVRALASYYKVPNEKVLIIYDDIALPVGTIRIREKGSSAGHNGVKSVISHMGTEAIPRIRVGVDRPADPRHSQIDWVLGRFMKEEQPLVEETIKRATEAVEAVFKIGIERAMNTYNTGPATNGKDDKPTKGESRREFGSVKGRVHGAKEPSGETPTGPSDSTKEEISIDSIRERIARIIRGE